MQKSWFFTVEITLNGHAAGGGDGTMTIPDGKMTASAIRDIKTEFARLFEQRTHIPTGPADVFIVHSIMLDD